MFINISIACGKRMFGIENPDISFINMSSSPITRVIPSNPKNLPVREKTFSATEISPAPSNFRSIRKEWFFAKTTRPFKFISQSLIPAFVSLFKSHISSINHIPRTVNKVDEWFGFDEKSLVQKLMPI